MGYARHIGRVGALAVTLGVGAAIANAPGIAYADTTGTSQNGDSSQKTTSSTPDTSSTTGQPTSPTDGAAADVGDLGSTTPDPKSQRRSVLRSVVVGAIRDIADIADGAVAAGNAAGATSQTRRSRMRRAAIRPTARHRTSRQLPPEPAPAQSHSTTRPRTCSRRSTRSPNALRRPSSNSAHPGRTTRQPTSLETQQRPQTFATGGNTAAATRPTPTTSVVPHRHGPSWRIAEPADIPTVRGRRHCRRRH